MDEGGRLPGAIVVYPAMPVTIKTPACPVIVAPVAPGTAGEWTIDVDGRNVKAEFRDSSGNLLGFALRPCSVADPTCDRAG